MFTEPIITYCQMLPMFICVDKHITCQKLTDITKQTEYTMTIRAQCTLMSICYKDNESSLNFRMNDLESIDTLNKT